MKESEKKQTGKENLNDGQNENSGGNPLRADGTGD